MTDKPQRPDQMLDGIYADDPRIDIFARRARRGWTVWG